MQVTRLHIGSVAATLALITTAPATIAHAQGFGLSEIGSCAVGRGFAVTAATCHDASVIYWNPAAAVRLPGKTVTAGDALIKVLGSFRQDTTNRRYKGDAPTEFPPHFFANYTSNTGQW